MSSGLPHRIVMSRSRSWLIRNTGLVDALGMDLWSYGSLGHISGWMDSRGSLRYMGINGHIMCFSYSLHHEKDIWCWPHVRVLFLVSLTYTYIRSTETSSQSPASRLSFYDASYWSWYQISAWNKVSAGNRPTIVGHVMRISIDTRKTAGVADSAPHECSLAPTDDDRPTLADVSNDVYTQTHRES